ncbi:hypothetical protein FRC02_005008 [Tulasnella sp. 418]|nr:hypothetical protein FRC02_005008 [Tulasnella sp. 418]
MSGVTPKPSSSVLPRSNSPSPPQQTSSSGQQNSSNSEGSPTSPTAPGPIGAGSGRNKGHSRIASTSTTTSRPEGYPSWIPRRPPPPAPASTFQSRPSTAADGRFASESPVQLGEDELSPSELDFALHAMAMDAGLESEPRQSIDDPQGSSSRRRRHPGSSSTHPSAVAASYRPTHERKPTPRSVRILGGGHNYATAPLRDMSDSTTRAQSASSPGFRAFSRATGTNASATFFSSSYPSRNGHHTLYPAILPGSQPSRPPRFRTPKFHPTLLVSPSRWTRFRYMLWGIFVVFGHLLLQSFLDFNIAFMLIQIAKHPTPSVISSLAVSSSPSDNSASSRNWTLATVAYIACWAIWVFGIWLCYEVVYCFWRRWRVKRPLLIPIYLSTPAFNLVSMTSYTNFCFLNHIRWSSLMLWDDAHSSVGGSVYEERISEGWEEVNASKNPTPEREGTEGANEGGEDDGSSVGHEIAEPEKVVTRTRNGVTHRRLPSQMSSEYGYRPRMSELSSEGRPQISELESDAEGRPVSSVVSGIALGEDGKPQVSELESSSNEVKEKKEESQDHPKTPEDPNRPSSTVPFPTQGPTNGAKNTNGNGNGNGAALSTTTSVRKTHFKDLNIRQFLAESCWFYSQNTPTISLLVPRLALSLALLVAFNGPAPGAAVLSAAGEAAFGRDGTFFEPRGQLSTYGKVIIWLNLIWGLWRILVLMISWTGLWIFSGLGCAGICGPRYRWEEPGAEDDEDDNPVPLTHEKRQSVSFGQRSGSVYNPRLSQVTIFDPRFSHRTGRQIFSDPDDHTLTWDWMISARERAWDIWEFCTTGTTPATTGNVTWRKSQLGGAVDAQVFAYRNAGGYSGFPLVTDRRPMMSQQPGRPTVTIPSPMISLQYSSSPSGYTATTETKTGTLLNTPVFFPPSAGTTGLGFSGMFGPGYAPLDQTVLSTLQEVASNPSLAAASSAAGASREAASPSPGAPTGTGVPTTMPTPLTAPATPLPVFTTPAPPRRGVLTADLFIDPTTTSTAPTSPPAPITVANAKSSPQGDEKAWAVAGNGKDDVAKGEPSGGPVMNLPYPFPSYSSTSPPPTRPTSSGGPPTGLPFPLTAASSARHTPNVIPTPATTIHSLPFPTPQGTLSTGHQAGLAQPSQQSHQIESYDDDFAMSEHDVSEHGVSEHGVLDLEGTEDRANSVGTGTNSMSSLGQPIQTRYPFGYRRPRNRSSYSGSGSVITSGSASHSGSGSGARGQPLSPRGSSVMGGSGNGSSSASGSGYGSNAIVRGRGSRSTRYSAVSVESGIMPGGADFEDYGEVVLGNSSMSSLGGPGMAGVGAGGGMGPRASLVNLGVQHNITPPPPNPRAGGGRRRAGTMPSPTAHAFHSQSQPPLPQQVGADLPRSSGSFRSRVASVPNPPSPSSRAIYAPMPMYEGGPTSYDAHGQDSDEEPEGSQEAAEREDSVGLLSAAPSPRNSLGNLRIRGSNVSLNRRAGGSRPVSLISSTSSSSPSRSRTGSLVAPPLPSGRRGSSPNPLPSPPQRSRNGSLIRDHQHAQVARSRANSGVEGSTSHYTDARSRTDSGSTSSGAHRTPEDLTFGVQVNWRVGQDEPISPPPPIVLRSAPSDISERTTSRPIDEDVTIQPGAGPSTFPNPHPIPIPSHLRGDDSRQDLSSANASFVTANPSMYAESTTETGRSVGGSSGNTWTRGTSNRYFAEGSGMYGPR